MGNEPKSEPLVSSPVMVTGEGTGTSITLQLESHWMTAVQELGVEAAKARPVFDKLVEMYTQEVRAYHNLKHVKAMLDFLDSHASEIQGMPQVVLAVFFHDAIYDSQANDNEEQSAALVQALMKPIGLASEDIEPIASLVQSTKKHHPILSGTDNRLFLDADLAILGSSPGSYLRYCDAIREEYAWVPQSDYIVGRKGVLESFLQRPEIYMTESVRGKLEERARENIAAEIQLLGESSA